MDLQSDSLCIQVKIVEPLGGVEMLTIGQGDLGHKNMEQ